MTGTALPLRSASDPSAASGDASRRPPLWLVVSTAALTLTCLGMAIAETTLWMHFLIDQGEYLSLVGLAFILAAGIHLYRRDQLFVSLPLAVPWLLYPVITQGDQLIDNLTITQMRIVCQILLALLFGAPVAVAVLAARYGVGGYRLQTLPSLHWTNVVPGLRPLAEGRIRLGSGLLAAALLLAEIWIAQAFLGTLMVITLTVMALAALIYAGSDVSPRAPAAAVRREAVALAVLITGVCLSFGLYVGFKNRPGAYQGSPAYYMDPSQKDAEYPLSQIAVPAAPAAIPSPEIAQSTHDALVEYGRSLSGLIDGYYIADRNYNYAFHNALFLRHTAVLPNFRRVALDRIEQAHAHAVAADARRAADAAALPRTDPLGAFVVDVANYVAFNFRRAKLLEAKTAEFERTEAGLQHATHIYEGEGKVLGVRLVALIDKHGRVTADPALAPVIGDFLGMSRAVYAKYANRIVGF